MYGEAAERMRQRAEQLGQQGHRTPQQQLGWLEAGQAELVQNQKMMMTTLSGLVSTMSSIELHLAEQARMFEAVLTRMAQPAGGDSGGGDGQPAPLLRAYVVRFELLEGISGSGEGDVVGQPDALPVKRDGGLSRPE